LDLLYACLDYPRSVVGGLYHRAKFSFKDKRFSMLWEYSFKMPTPLFGCFWGNENFLHFYRFRNAITCDLYLVNQTASNWLLQFCLLTRAKIEVTKNYHFNMPQ